MTSTSDAPINEFYIREHFATMERGDYEAFFSKVLSDVDWTVMGSHVLSGHYTSRDEFQKRTFARLGPRLRDGIKLRLTSLIVNPQTGDAAVELSAVAVQKNGRPFDNKYSWIVHYNGDGHVDRIRAYLDGNLVDQTIRDNDGP